MLSADLSIILPEILLSVFAMVALLAAVYSSKDDLAPAMVWITAIVMAGLGVWIGATGEGTHVAFGGMFVDDGFARFAKVTILVSAACVLIMSQDYMQRRGLLTIAVLAAIPNPAFDLAGIAAGALRLPLWKFLVGCAIGGIIKNTVFALAGYYGIGVLSNLFGG